MKEIFKFISWQWNQWESWQKVWICSSAFVGAAIGAPQPYAYYLGIIPTVIVLGYMIKWVVWDGAKAQWQKYQKEKQDLLETIKNSDKITTR